MFFNRNVTNKVSNQKTLYYATSKILCTSALPGKTGKHENHIFFAQMLYQRIARNQPVAA